MNTGGDAAEQVVRLFCLADECVCKEEIIKARRRERNRNGSKN